MAHKDLRELLSVLEENGKLRRVKRQVDPTWELSCMARWVFQGFPPERRFALLFENVKGSSMSVGTALLGASRDVYALAMGTTPEKIHDAWLQALRNPLPPKVVDSAPVHEVVIPKEKIDLAYLPVPTWTPGKDSKPCITAVNMTRNRETGVQNMGTYRHQIQSRNTITFNSSPGRQGRLNYESYASKGEPAPVAAALGCAPAVHLATSGSLPKGVDEMFIAGGLTGAPIEVVKAKTIDMLVPAHAEIVIEGLMHPADRIEELSFGEFAGYMGRGGGPKPVFEVTCITHRANPIYYGYISQMPPSESTMIQGQANECITHKMLVDDFGEFSVTDTALNQTHGGNLGHIIVQMQPRFPGHAKKIGRMVCEFTGFKMVTIVDTDIDIRHQQDLDWVTNSRVLPTRDIITIGDVFYPNDPSSVDGMNGKVIIDATQEGVFPDISLPPKDLMWKAYESWQDADLPAFNIPRRVERVLDFHAERMSNGG